VQSVRGDFSDRGSAAHSEGGPGLQPGWWLSVWTEPLIGALCRSKRLNSIGKWLGRTFHRLVGVGVTKDAIAGTWLGHPLHPLLTDVTIGAWTSAAALDLLGGEKTQPAADMLAGVGILSAIPTAISGLSDLTDVLDSEERSLGTAHALINIGVLGLWSLSYLARKAGSRRAGMELSAAALASMTAAGFLGGHLSYRMGLGVDQTAFEPRLADWTSVMEATELAEGKPRRVMVSGTNVLLYRTGEEIRALANRCSHRGGPLHKGAIDQQRVTCPWHLSAFRLVDGAILRGPATAPQPTYDVRVHEGNIEIRTRAAVRPR
jgi:nitrite reductase/ring-hydroxylating ferredoxin subunit/uncharacterized membrane protein